MLLTIGNFFSGIWSYLILVMHIFTENYFLVILFFKLLIYRLLYFVFAAVDSEILL